MPFRLATVVSSNPFDFANAHRKDRVILCKECALVKLIGLLLRLLLQAEMAFIHA